MIKFVKLPIYYYFKGYFSSYFRLLIYTYFNLFNCFWIYFNILGSCSEEEPLQIKRKQSTSEPSKKLKQQIPDKNNDCNMISCK